MWQKIDKEYGSLDWVTLSPYGIHRTHVRVFRVRLRRMSPPSSGLPSSTLAVPYVLGFCCVKRAMNSSFPISRTTHFDKRSAISVARTCLHWKQPGVYPVAQKTGYAPSAETAISTQSKRRLGMCRSEERSRSHADLGRRCRNRSCQ